MIRQYDDRRYIVVSKTRMRMLANLAKTFREEGFNAIAASLYAWIRHARQEGK